MYLQTIVISNKNVGTILTFFYFGGYILEKIKTLNYSFWKYFKEISAIPRKSGEEYKIAQYYLQFFSKKYIIEFVRKNIFTKEMILWMRQKN